MQCCILSKFYIKPQHPSKVFDRYLVVSYRNSTSNHNSGNGYPVVAKLYLIEILHQTTTEQPKNIVNRRLYLIEILHQTTTVMCAADLAPTLYLIEILHQTTTIFTHTTYKDSCILSKFYIKPQPRCPWFFFSWVVSYRNSTSNHNLCCFGTLCRRVVSYRNSTSNHNHGRY